MLDDMGQDTFGLLLEGLTVKTNGPHRHPLEPLGHSLISRQTEASLHRPVPALSLEQSGIDEHQGIRHRWQVDDGNPMPTTHLIGRQTDTILTEESLDHVAN